MRLFNTRERVIYRATNIKKGAINKWKFTSKFRGTISAFRRIELWEPVEAGSIKFSPSFEEIVMPLYAVVAPKSDDVNLSERICSFDGEHHTFFGNPGLADQAIEEMKLEGCRIVPFNICAIVNSMTKPIQLVIQFDGEGHQTIADKKFMRKYLKRHGQTDLQEYQREKDGEGGPDLKLFSPS